MVIVIAVILFVCSNFCGMSSRPLDIAKEPELGILAEKHNLYLKPVARIHFTVQLPILHDASGRLRSVTTWEIIEKLRQFCPVVLSPSVSIRVLRTTLEFVRLIAEVETKSDVKRVVTCLDNQYIKLSGFPQNLHVRASEAPSDCPRRHDWESFFRDTEEMDETKYGERPDTIVLDGLPVRWFTDTETVSSKQPSTNITLDRPSPKLLSVTFSTFGAVRNVDIPMLDPVQNPSCLNEYLIDHVGFTESELLLITDTPTSTEYATLQPDTIKTDIQTGGFGKIGPDTISVMSGHHRPSSLANISPQIVTKALSLSDSNKSDKNLPTLPAPLTFSAHIQYKDYNGFLKAMENLRGQKLVYAPPSSEQPNSEKNAGHKVYFTADMKIDFDRTKHLSEHSILVRQMERDRLVSSVRHQVEEAKLLAEAKARERRLVEDAKRKAEERRLAESLAQEAEQAAKAVARVERKKQRATERCKRTKDSLVKRKIALDEHRRLLAIRKTQSFRLMTFLLSRIQDRHNAIVAERRLIRLVRAEKAASEAETIALSTVKNRKVKANDSNFSNEADVVNPRKDSTLGPSSDRSLPDSDLLLYRLLQKREDSLRALLLKKRNSSLSLSSSSTVQNKKSPGPTMKICAGHPR